MPRLVSISWRNAPGLPGLRPSSLQTFDVGQRGGFYDDWRVIVDGPVILLVSPIGWTPQEYNKRHQAGERCVYELPRKDAALRWAFGSDDEIAAPAKWKQPEPAVVAVPDLPADPVEFDEVDEPIVRARPATQGSELPARPAVTRRRREPPPAA